MKGIHQKQEEFFYLEISLVSAIISIEFKNFFEKYY